MDYSIGSVSDLITGLKTPNKKKVIKKKISLQESIEANSEEVAKNEDKGEQKKKKKMKKTALVPEIIEDEVKGKKKKIKKTAVVSEITEKPQKKKRKLSIANGSESSPPKKSKNEKNAERRVKLKEKNDKPEEDPELLSRTVFVGNLPIASNPKKLKRFFTKYGTVETIRIRGVPVADPKMPKKVAIIKKHFHPDRKSFFGFVRFQDREGAVKATEANGTIYQEHHLRVHLCDISDKPDENKAIFVGNLSFCAEENDLWKTFGSCGPIDSVRIVRDNRTGMGKGFGYVNFQNSDAVPLALEMENVKLNDRELRISICNLNAAKKNKKNDKAKKITKPGKAKNAKKRIKTDTGDVKENGGKSENANNTNQTFQGVKFVAKKKKKLNKGLLQKKKKAKQIAPNYMDAFVVKQD